VTRVQIERLIAEIENELAHLGRIKAQVEEARSRFDDTEPDGFGIQGVALVLHDFYNAAENIPWVRDNAKNDPWVANVDETYDVSEYVIKLGTHAYRLGDLTHYGTRVNDRIGPVGTIGADGLFGVPQARGVKQHQTWSRFLHIGWDSAKVGGNWPKGMTKDDIEAAIVISLWKPLYDDANVNVPLAAGKVELLLEK